MPMDRHVVDHLKAALVTVAACWAVVVGSLVLFPGAPGPHLSGNIAFNERAKWLRRTLADGRCDVVVLGSSIGLNSFDADAFKSRWPGKVVNTGISSMTAVDALRILEILMKRCQPRVVVLPTSHVDFAGAPGDFDWPQFTRYVNGGPAASIWTYARNMDIAYYALHASQAMGEAYRQNRLYASLGFDRSGAVLFACDNFRISPQRWDGYRASKVAPVPSPSNLAALADIARLLSKNKIVFIVAAVPLRPAAEKFLASAELTAAWRVVEGSVVPYGAVFVRTLAAGAYDDSQFVDFAHLNNCGARKWTGEVLDSARDFIERSMRSVPE